MERDGEKSGAKGDLGFDEYQRRAGETDLYEATREVCAPGFLEKVMGLAGEAGEVTDKFKKIVRDGDGVATEADRAAIGKELGDVLWYVAAIARYLELPLSEVAEGNLGKLRSRRARGTLHGSGDNR